MSAVERTAGRWLERLALAGVLALMSAMLVAMADIVARKALGFSIKGTIDVEQLAQIACVFCVLPVTFLREANITVDFLTDRLPPRPLAWLRCAVQVLCALLLAAIAWYSADQALVQVRNGDRSQTLGIPMVLYWAPMLFGTAVSVAATLLLALKYGLAAAYGPAKAP